MYKTFDRYKIFFIFWIIAFFAFIRGYNAGWIHDSIKFSLIVKNTSLLKLIELNIDNTIRYLYHIIYYTFEYVFNEDRLIWYIFRVTLHTLNAYLLYLVINQIILLYANIKNNKIAFISSILFLISPYQTEAIFYNAALHFLIAPFFIFLSIYLLLLLISNRVNKSYIFYFYLLYILALFTLETSYTLFFVYLNLIYFYKPINQLNKHKLYIYLVVLPFFILILYLLLLNYTVGEFIGHYGIEKHTRLWFTNTIQNITKIPLDFYLFIEYWSMNNKNIIHTLLYRTDVCIILFLFYITIYLTILFIYLKYERNTIYILLINILIFMFLPTMNLGILYIVPIEEDRYLYYYSSFAYFLIIFILNNISERLMYSVSFIIFIIGFLLLQQNIYNWNIGQKTIDTTLKTFKYTENKRYILLASAVYANGVLIWDTKEDDKNPFEDGVQQILAKALEYKYNYSLINKIAPVIQYNITDTDICPIIEILNDTTLKYTLPCCGHWWWKKNFGATDFENDYYKVKMIGGWQQEVLVTLKQKPKDMVYLYQCGEKFVTLDF